MRLRGFVPSVGLVVTEVKTLAGGLVGGLPAHADGSGAQAGFYYPYGVAVDSSSNIFVVERFAHRIRKVTPNGGMHEVHAFFDNVRVLLCVCVCVFSSLWSMHPLAP